MSRPPSKPQPPRRPDTNTSGNNNDDDDEPPVPFYEETNAAPPNTHAPYPNGIPPFYIPPDHPCMASIRTEIAAAEATGNPVRTVNIPGLGAIRAHFVAVRVGDDFPFPFPSSPSQQQSQQQQRQQQGPQQAGAGASVSEGAGKTSEKKK